MKLVLFEALIVAVLPWVVAVAFDGVAAVEIPHGRRLFYRKECNRNLASAACTPWTTYFGPFASSNVLFEQTTAVIACGDCVVLDAGAGDEPTLLTMPRGLEVTGKLVIPEGQRVSMRLPFLQIEGEMEMYATKIPNGTPDIEITLIENADADTAVGLKPIYIAGGKLTFVGLPPECPTWVRLVDTVGPFYDYGGPLPSRATALVVPYEVRTCFGIGAEVLITSHTYRFDDQQVRKITGISNFGADGDNLAVLFLNDTIRHPTTLKESPDFAVEVALLSRNIRFQAESEGNVTRGGHMIVDHTPSVQQRIEGIEVRNFGQQGTLGKYPIHFHFCGDVTGSVVAKNLIRESNQRCVVSHATDNLLIEGNIAYDTHGHCFMTEDGMETGNIFRSNLGALTKIPSIVIPENPAVNNGKESDGVPSTFWLTNPNNTVQGNVAAGSESTGFWFEFGDKVRGLAASSYDHVSPITVDLGIFEDNVAHSNSGVGIRTYPNGYIPSKTAVFKNCRSFRNGSRGFFAHNSRNIEIKGGIFADNRVQVDFDRANNMTLRDAEVIGISQHMKDVFESNIGDQSMTLICRRGDPGERVHGVELHSFAQYSDRDGSIIQNVTFTGFTDTDCSGFSTAVDFDNEVRFGTFDSLSTLLGNSLEDGAAPVAMCDAIDQGYHNVFLIDLDSTLSPLPNTLPKTTTSTFIAAHDTMRAFVDPSKCTLFERECYEYCTDTCFRSVMFAISPLDTEDVLLKVCAENDGSKCVSFKSYIMGYDPRYDLEDPNDRHRRRYHANLPGGRKYKASFVDSTGSTVWTTFVETVYKNELCEGGPGQGDISLIIPPAPSDTCDQLIRNGNVENGVSAWVARVGGLKVLEGKGIYDSNALSEKYDTLASNAFSQFLDSRCMSASAGKSFEISAWVKFVDRTTGEDIMCDPFIESCPVVRLGSRNGNGPLKAQTVASVTAGGGPILNQFQLINGIVTIPNDVANSDTVILFVEKVKRDVTFVIDNVSMHRVEQGVLPVDSTTPCGPNLVKNGDFNEGLAGWQVVGGGSIHSLKPGLHGLGDSAALLSGGGLVSQLNADCFEAEARYFVSAKYKAFNSTTGAEIMSLLPILFAAETVDGDRTPIAYASGIGVDEGWSIMSGIFVASRRYLEAGTVVLGVNRRSSALTLSLDDISVSPMAQDCHEIILNGDMELGPNHFWLATGTPRGSISTANGFSGYGLRFSGRAQLTHGVRYNPNFIDFSCLPDVKKFRITAQVRLVKKGTEQGASCDLSSTCPKLHVFELDEDGASYGTTTNSPLSYITMAWNEEGFNYFETVYEPVGDWSALKDLYLIWRDYPLDLDLIVDDFSMVPIELKSGATFWPTPSPVVPTFAPTKTPTSPTIYPFPAVTLTDGSPGNNALGSGGRDDANDPKSGAPSRDLASILCLLLLCLYSL